MSSKVQRVGIWVIAGAMILGTVVGFVAMILSSQNSTKEQAVLQKYQAAAADAQKKQDAQTKELSDTYYGTFNQYANVPAKFDAASVTALSTQDLKIGDGAVVSDASSLACYYILWLPDGKVSQQSISNGALSAPLAIAELKPASLIDGWKQGLVGMKIGGVREISIPSSLGYKDQAQTDSSGNVTIPANTPLKFVVMAIPKPADIPQPAVTKEVLDAYQSQQQ